jgi:hypothetical protein
VILICSPFGLGVEQMKIIKFPAFRSKFKDDRTRVSIKKKFGFGADNQGLWPAQTLILLERRVPGIPGYSY